MLAGVLGKVLPMVGVPVVTVKPVGKTTSILATLVGVVFNLIVTNRSLLVVADIPKRPKRTPAWFNVAACAGNAGNSVAAAKTINANSDLIFIFIWYLLLLLVITLKYALA
jgi:hypothetical protein